MRTATARAGPFVPGPRFPPPAPVSFTTVTALPQAIQMVLPIIASDGGQARVGTLLAIHGVGPDYLRNHLTDIDAALGAVSPGTAALADLIRQAENAVTTSSTVRRQHFISQGVLRRYVENVPPHGRVLAKFDITAGQTELTGTNGVGYVDHFVPVDSQTTEALWQEVETHLTQAINAALNGTALTSPAHLTTLRRAVALHFAQPPDAHHPQPELHRHPPGPDPAAGQHVTRRQRLLPRPRNTARRPRRPAHGRRGDPGTTHPTA